MKAEHRHELKTNELAEWIANLPEWAKDNARTIIYISVGVVLVAAAGIWYWYNRNVESAQRELELTNLILQLPRSKLQVLQAQASGTDASVLLNAPATRLEAAARNAESNQMAALALIKRAEALRSELHYRQSAVSQIDLDSVMAEAISAYRQALEKARPNRSLMAIARFGLGLCEEELGNFDQAEQIYRDVANEPLFKGTVAAAQAQVRLDTMTEYKTKIVFRPPPTPKRAPVELPPVLPRPTEVDLTAPPANAIPLPPDISLAPNEPNAAPLLKGIDRWLLPPGATPAAPDVNRQAPPSSTVPTLPDVKLSPDAPNTAAGVPDSNRPGN